MKKICLFFILLGVFPLTFLAQDSRQKEEILSARKQEKEKIKNRKYCAKLTFGQGTSDNRCFETYPGDVLIWGKGFSEGLAKITVNGKAGFINKKGEIVIKPKLKDAGRFSENLAPFEADSGKWGYLDPNGEVVIKPQFDWAISFHEGLALVQVGELWGYIDRTGKIVIEPKFGWAQSFSEGLAGVREQFNSYGFIDKSGNWIIEPQFNWVSEFKEGFALVAPEGDRDAQEKMGYIDRTGKFIWKPTK